MTKFLRRHVQAVLFFALCAFACGDASNGSNPDTPDAGDGRRPHDDAGGGGPSSGGGGDAGGGGTANSNGGGTTDAGHGGGDVRDAASTGDAASSGGAFTHFFGGFMVDSSSDMDNAVSLGVTLDLPYTDNPSATTRKDLQGHNMGLIPALNYVYDKSSNGAQTYMQNAANDPLIRAYWILDDWNGSPGGAKQILIDVTKYAHQSTPNKPTICGFGGIVDKKGGGSYYWDDSIAENFTPEGCDMVGFYWYGDSGTAADYDWSMPGILKAAFDSLTKRGWDQSKTPIIGIPQVFGGGNWVLPDESSVETQAKAYCQAGAVGLIYYGWHEQVETVLPTNTPDVANGIKAGSAACKQIWGVP